MEKDILEGLKNAWVSKSGRVVFRHPDFNGMGAWHEKLADCILSDMGKHKGESSTEQLESMGWIRLHGFEGSRPRWICDPDKIPKKQVILIQSWCISNNKHFEEVFD